MSLRGLSLAERKPRIRPDTDLDVLFSESLFQLDAVLGRLDDKDKPGAKVRAFFLNLCSAKKQGCT